MICYKMRTDDCILLTRDLPGGVLRIIQIRNMKTLRLGIPESHLIVLPEICLELHAIHSC